MRIVHVSDCYVPRLGGIERQVHDLAARQRARGHQVRVVTSTTGPGGEDLPVARPQHRRRVPPGEIRYRWSLPGRRAVFAEPCDLVHIHASAFSPMAFLTAASASAAGIPTAVTVHSLWAYAFPLFRAADALTGWGRWRAAWSAVSLVAAEQVQRIVGPATDVTVLPNGVDIASWHVEPAERDPKRVVIATVGRLAPRKRPKPFLEMLRRVRARLDTGIGLEVVVFGDGPQRRSLQHFVEHHDMGGWVQLRGTGDHEQIRNVYRRADLYVAPATLESFGIAALEARAAGLPVVAYADTGVASFIAHGVEGLLARGDDEMVAHILRLAESPAARRAIREHNLAHSPAMAWDAVLGACEDLYERAFAAAGRTPSGARSLALAR